MLRRQRCPDSLACAVDVTDRGSRCDVLENDTQLGKTLHCRLEYCLDEADFTLKNVDVASQFTVHLQHHAALGHPFQHRINAAYIGDSGSGVCGCTGRI